MKISWDSNRDPTQEVFFPVISIEICRFSFKPDISFYSYSLMPISIHRNSKHTMEVSQYRILNVHSVDHLT